MIIYWHKLNEIRQNLSLDMTLAEADALTQEEQKTLNQILVDMNLLGKEYKQLVCTAKVNFKKLDTAKRFGNLNP